VGRVSPKKCLLLINPTTIPLLVGRLSRCKRRRRGRKGGGGKIEREGEEGGEEQADRKGL